MITRGRFEAGQRINLNNRFGVIRLFENDLAVVKYEDGDDVMTCLPSELREAFKVKRLYFAMSKDNAEHWHPLLTDKQKMTIARRLPYVKAMDAYKEPHKKANRAAVIEIVSQETNDLKPPAIASISRWYKPWKKNKRNDFYLLPGKGGRKSDIHPLMHELMSTAVVKGYLKLSKPPKVNAYELLQELFRKSDLESIGITLPSVATFNRFIDEWDRLDMIEKRDGISQARAEARSANKKFKTQRVLQEVQADTGHFNIGLLSECRKYYIGKPTIYFIFDVHSRSLLGYSIEIREGGETPSGAIHAFKHAMEVKPNNLEYPMFGIIENAGMDNGVGYRSEETKTYLRKVGCQGLTYNKTHAGWAKAFVERFIGSSRSMLFSKMDGYLGKYDPKKFKTDPLKKHAKYTLSEFAEAFEHFVIQYHAIEQDGLNGYSPLEIWEQSSTDYPPLALNHSEYLDMLIGENHCGKLSHATGIKIGKQHFNSDELQEIYHANISKHSKDNSIDIEFLVDWSDASSISVQHPNQDILISVPNTDDDSIGKSFAEISCVHKKNEVDRPTIANVVTSLGPVLTPTAARSKIMEKVQRRGVDVPNVPVGADVDFNLFLQQSNVANTSSEPPTPETTENTSTGEMNVAEDIETNDDY